MYTTPLCRPSQSLAVTCRSHVNTSSDIENLEHFQWSKLNTPKRKIKRTYQRYPKSIDQMQTICQRRLEKLDRAKQSTEGLELIIAGINSMVAQKWKTLLVYFNEDVERPDLDRPWSHIEWRKWDVIEFLTRVAVSYNDVCETVDDDLEGLEVADVDVEFLSLINDVIALGAAKEEVIAIKEWERPGTMATMEAKTLFTSE